MGALLLSAAPAVMAAGETGVTVMVMKHACNPDVKNLDDFNAIIDGADGPVAALAATVLACPAIVNPGDDSTNGVKSEPAEFSFEVADSAGTNNMPANSMKAKLCESDLQLDADGDGTVSEPGPDDVCLDVSHYVFDGLASGPITVTETAPPSGYRFGEVLFTPTEIDHNNDAESLASLDRESGVIELDTSADEDGMVMLHVYNFEKEMPDTATASETDRANEFPVVSILLLLGVAGAFGLWLTIGSRRIQPTTK